MNCIFGDVAYVWGSFYSCQVTSLENSNNNIIITEQIGTHILIKNDNDVKAINIINTITKFIPANLGLLFNLTVFRMYNTQLIKFKAEDFNNMENLEYLDLHSNKLTTIPINAFSNLRKLKQIHLSSNGIEELQNGLFNSNVDMETINVFGNKIKFLGSGIFDRLEKLKKVDMNSNICMAKVYQGTTEILQIKQDMQIQCKHPNDAMDVKLTEISAEIKTEFVEISGMIKKLVKATDESNENNNLRAELIELKKKQKNYEILMNEKLNNLQRENNKLHLELFLAKDLKNEFEIDKSSVRRLDFFNVKCNFEKITEGYSCVTNEFIISHRDMIIKEVIGTHLMSNTNVNVTELKIANTSMLFWSNKIFNTFPAIETVKVHHSNLKQLSKGDFGSCSTLKVLEVQGNEIKTLGDDIFEGEALEQLIVIKMEYNQIEKVSAGTFNGLKKLKMLSLKDNFVTELNLRSFKDVVTLEILILTGNKIKSLDGKLFQFNKQLITLFVDQNELLEVGEDILNYSEVLKNVNFDNNYCFYDNLVGRELYELKFNIKHCCKNPIGSLKVYNCGKRGWDS